MDCRVHGGCKESDMTDRLSLSRCPLVSAVQEDQPTPEQFLVSRGSQGQKKKSGPCKFLLSSEFNELEVLNECSCPVILSHHFLFFTANILEKKHFRKNSYLLNYTFHRMEEAEERTAKHNGIKTYYQKIFIKNDELR